MAKIIINVNGKNIIAMECRRPKGYKLAHGIIGGDNDSLMEDMKNAVIGQGYSIIKAEFQSSAWGPIPTIYFKQLTHSPTTLPLP